MSAAPINMADRIELRRFVGRELLLCKEPTDVEERRCAALIVSLFDLKPLLSCLLPVLGRPRACGALPGAFLRVRFHFFFVPPRGARAHAAPGHRAAIGAFQRADGGGDGDRSQRAPPPGSPPWPSAARGGGAAGFVSIREQPETSPSAGGRCEQSPRRLGTPASSDDRLQ